ncbi:MAG: YraN family protein [Planctomycetes bacterium]|nr:YraN family protein [Planctomycetota bacterium]
MFVVDLFFAVTDYCLNVLQRGRRKPHIKGSPQRMAGDKAELFALAQLQREGFSLIERNLSDSRGELDLVGRQNGFDGIVVVEVRSRSEGSPLDPRDTVRGAKKRQVINTARRLLKRRQLDREPVRFDIVGVWVNAAGEPVKAERFADAFDAGILKKR